MFVLLGQVNSASAYQIQSIDNTPVSNDFVLGPGKVDLVLEPGEKSTQQITVTNRLGQDMNFKVGVEDFSGSYDTDQTIVLLGDKKGPYSMKDFIKPETTEFTLKHGERITIPVEIDIPKDTQPGGLYASVLVSTVPDSKVAENQGQAKIISRLGTLYFVRVAGEVNEAGYLQNFKVTPPANGFYEKGPIPFEIYYKNEGNVHLKPTGTIKIENMLGKKVGEVTINIDPNENYFVMPNSLRKMVKSWEGSFLIGKYTATLTMNSNYQLKAGDAQTMAVSFWIIPWKIILAVIVALIALVYLAHILKTRFKFEIKKK
jgi:hypothetical protein